VQPAPSAAESSTAAPNVVPASLSQSTADFSVPPWLQGNITPAAGGSSAGPIVAPPLSTEILVPSLPEHPAVEPPPQELEATRIVARVGGEVILAGEVLSSVNGFLAKNGVDPNAPEVQPQKAAYVKMRLKQLVDTRMVVNEARQKIPPEGYKKAMEKFDEEFYKSVAPKLAQDRKLPDVAALEVQLRKDGTTLEREKHNFAEMVLCNSYLAQNVHIAKDVTHAEMLKYYQEHGAEYDHPAEARWEQISVRFDAFPSKAEAYAAIAQLGNEVVAGRPFADAARAASHGSTASQGGAHPWTKQGSLVSKALDQALFTLPVGELSPIIEDKQAFHIVRVVERREAGRMPFTDAQVFIRKKIVDQRTMLGEKELIDQIRARTKVWTIYDEEEIETAAAQKDNRYR
jgi:parvulin-like peptidyl-prolyl isomerase